MNFRRIVPKLAQQFEAFRIRRHQINQHQIGRMLADEIERFIRFCG
jgi:hypothetical protein